MSDEVIENMRGRAAKCRWLATRILDEAAAQALRDMAQQIEADIIQLEAERGDPQDPVPPVRL